MDTLVDRDSKRLEFSCHFQLNGFHTQRAGVDSLTCVKDPAVGGSVPR